MPRYVHIDSEDPYYLPELTPNLCVARHAGATLHAPSGRPFTDFLNIKYFDINTLRIPKKGDTGVKRLGWGPINGVYRYNFATLAGSKYTGRSISRHLSILLGQFHIGLSLGFLIQELD
ncbi:hypothetical protein FIBSPDRAFT_923889, partial [Athelia psychrophila]